MEKKLELFINILKELEPFMESEDLDVKVEWNLCDSRFEVHVFKGIKILEKMADELGEDIEKIDKGDYYQNYFIYENIKFFCVTREDKNA